MTTTNAEALYTQRKERLDKALKLEKADKVPVLIMGPIPCAKLADRSIVVADAIERHEYFLDKAFDGVEMLKDVDSLQGFSSSLSKTKGLAFLCNVKQPGVELGRDDMIQIVEKPQMTYEDYRLLIDEGWKKFSQDYISERLGLTPEDFLPGKVFKTYAEQKTAEYGYVEWGGGANTGVWDLLTSMRGMNIFFRDLRKDPQLIKDAMAAIDAESFPDFKASLDKGIGKAYSVMVQPGVRANCDFISRKVYEEFVWPYTMKYADAVIEAGIPVHFHYDAKWDSFLDFFTYFPKYKCVFDSDGLTDIYKVKEILGDRMAITGNTPPALLALGTPDEVYNFVRKQITDLGENGYIVTSSCTIPSNCKPENLVAMVSACRA